MWTVLAFYPNLGTKVRKTEYKNYDGADGAMDYISGLRMCKTPYMLLNQEYKLIHYELFDIKRETMIEMFEMYC